MKTMVAGCHPTQAQCAYQRMPGLHQGWSTTFDSAGSCVAEDKGGRDTKAIALETKDVIDEMKAAVERSMKQSEAAKRAEIYEYKKQLANDMSKSAVQVAHERDELAVQARHTRDVRAALLKDREKLAERDARAVQQR